MIVTPGAATRRPDKIADGYVASLTLGAGQFCTNPGILFLPEGTDVLDRITAQLTDRPATPMLNERIEAHYLAAAEKLIALPGASKAVWLAHANSLAPRLITMDLDAFAHTPEAAEECFGPLGVVITYRRLADLLPVVSGLPGQLTTTLHANDDESPHLSELATALTDRSGRVLWNDWPTGVTVTTAMQHGGPFPATTTPTTTSVGTAAIERFLRPVAYQGWPQQLLPPPLRDDNPWNVPQHIDLLTEELVHSAWERGCMTDGETCSRRYRGFSYLGCRQAHMRTSGHPRKR